MSASGPPRTRPRAAASALLAAALAVAAVGCDRTGAADPTPSPTPTIEPTPTPTPTPTPSPTPEADDPWDDPLRGAPPPELDLVGHNDPWRIATSRHEFRMWAFTNPDPDLSAEINHQECECHDTTVRLLTHYQDEGLWWTGGIAEVVDVDVLDDHHPDVRIIRVTLHRDEPTLLVDDEGTVHDELPPQRTVEDWVFVRDDENSPWLLRDFAEQERRDLTEESNDDA